MNVESFLGTYLFVALGILVSIIIPILRQFLPHPGPGPSAKPGFAARVLKIARPYLIVLAFSLATAAMIFAFVGDAIKDPSSAFIAGYAWDSTLQKIKG